MRQIPHLIALIFLLGHPFCCRSEQVSSDAEVRRHYDAAYRLQAEGHLADADAEHVAFLVKALTKVANGYANVGDYSHARPIYDEALLLAPDDFDLLKNFGAAALDAKEFEIAGQLLSTSLKEGGQRISPVEASSLWRKLGDSDLELKHRDAYLRDYETALELDHNCDNLFAAERAQLIVRGREVVSDAFKPFLSQCGDSPINHFKMGRAYALNDFPDEAAREFQAAIGENATLPGLHYSLGAAYLTESKQQFDKAESEFRKELALNPDDRFSYSQLGHIAMVRHQFRAAEADYRRAIALDPLGVQNYIQLGQILSDEDRRTEAEPLLKRAIDLTTDPSKDKYMILRAHFMLGRMLLKDGKTDEGKRELAVSQKFFNRSQQNDIDALNAASVPILPLVQTRISTAGERRANTQFVARIAPLIAGSYNNLGVHAAMANDFVKATRSFEMAAKWNPQQAGIDMNWGRAAFFAHMCAGAVSPLERALATHPGNGELQNMLATCREQNTNRPNP